MSLRPARHVGELVNDTIVPTLYPIERQQAIVIGVGTYAAGFKKLDNSSEDARSVAEVVSKDYGFTLVPDNGPLLDRDADLDTIRSFVQWTLTETTAATRWLFYFAGHGVAVDGQGYLVPSDAVYGKVGTHLSLQWLIDLCIGSPCGEALIILDTCYGGRALVRRDQLSDFIPEQSSAEGVRQLITSGNPDQPVLDGGGAGHSVFTQALLEALQGWAGIHDRDGSIRFPKLLDHLVFEVPARLRSQGLRTTQQQPIGGNLVGNRWRREFTFRCTAPRLSPETVRGTRSDDPGRRRQDLARLVEECRQAPQHVLVAVTLATAHLGRTPMEGDSRLVTSTLRYEPVAEVRAEAAKVLGHLGDLAVVPALIRALDDNPVVCSSAAQALGQLGAAKASVPLLQRLRTSGDDLLLDLTDALGAIGDKDSMLKALQEAKRRGRLVPFVGPDFPRALTGLPDRATLAQRLAQREGVPESGSLAKVADASLGAANSRYGFTAFMKRELDDQLLQPGSVHQALAALQVPFWISGAYDGLLVKAMEANQIVTGEDTKYWRTDRPTVVRLMGDLAAARAMVVLTRDYQLLRENEGDRQILISYLWRALEWHVVLFLGYDPRSPDFALLVDHVLNRHLQRVDARAVLVWSQQGAEHRWGNHPIRFMQQDELDLLHSLGTADGIS